MALARSPWECSSAAWGLQLLLFRLLDGELFEPHGMGRRDGMERLIGMDQKKSRYMEPGDALGIVQSTLRDAGKVDGNKDTLESDFGRCGGSHGSPTELRRQDPTLIGPAAFDREQRPALEVCRSAARSGLKSIYNRRRC
jgi:hypothetical protein